MVWCAISSTQRIGLHKNINTHRYLSMKIIYTESVVWTALYNRNGIASTAAHRKSNNDDTFRNIRYELVIR